jgi:hypothetical protein
MYLRKRKQNRLMQREKAIHFYSKTNLCCKNKLCNQTSQTKKWGTLTIRKQH